MAKTDTFAHVLLPNFYHKMLEINPNLPKDIPFINNEVLTNINVRKKFKIPEVKQIISYVNVNPEDYVDAAKSYELCKEANEELISAIKENGDLFYGGIAMIPMNNINGAIDIMMHQVAPSSYLFGIQLFTRHLGKSVADDSFSKIFETASKLDMPIWLHPVFDDRKPDNNIVFSWEYELSQAMMDIVKKGLFKKYPNLKIIVHHAGAMIPFFAGRIKYILGEDSLEDFKKFYVDTAILGNPKALDLAASFFGTKHLVFGTDAPLGIMPAGATKEISEAIENMNATEEEKEDIFQNNIMNLIKKGERNE